MLLQISFQLAQLQNAGGNNVKDCVNNVMSTLLTNKGASYYNLDGRKGVHSLVHKKSITKLALYKVVEGKF